MLLIAPVAMILVAENLGHIKAVSAMTGRNLDPTDGPRLRRRRHRDDGLGRGGGTGVTTYAENIGVMAATKIYSTAMFVVAALIAVLLGFSPKFGALIQAIPLAVMGGVSIVVFGLIAWPAPRSGSTTRSTSPTTQPHRGRRHAGAGHGRLHAEVRRLRARRHRHCHLRRDPAVRAAGLPRCHTRA
jgi:xanthine/uracil permease